MSTLAAEERVTKLFKKYEPAYAHDYYTRDMTFMSHALQTAELAKNSGADEETILAALFINVGFFARPISEWTKDVRYELMKYLFIDVNGREHVADSGICGSRYLQYFGFPKKTCKLLESNTLAKSYIWATDPTYVNNLNMDPMQKIAWQMELSDTKKSEFEKDPLFKEKVQLVKWGVTAATKTKDSPPDLDTYRDMVIRNIQI
ncbi:hypothetical protein GGI09_004401 [Coemansia sp. S100]|nr:hypothetical protein LPJ71_003530 [Coemansia sp. S17]KAJ2096351.1 hypothetical protein GGI09_004401 [Coemansia sp. S100]KAJ2106685.1 hypothetical protein GGI16_001830 [Coemansia sp. S142-1]